MTKSETDCITAPSPRCLHSLPDHYQYRDRRWAPDRRIKKVRRGKQNHKEKTSKPFQEADKNNKDARNRNAIIKAHRPECGKSFLEPPICSLVYYMINTIISDVFMITTVILNEYQKDPTHLSPAVICSRPIREPHHFKTPQKKKRIRQQRCLLCLMADFHFEKNAH